MWLLSALPEEDNLPHSRAFAENSPQIPVLRGQLAALPELRGEYAAFPSKARSPGRERRLIQ